MLSTGTSRCPPEPAITQVARAAISGGTLSAAGEALHRLPASDARPWIWVEPIRFAPSTMPGQACRRRACSPITAPEVAAPMMNTPSSSRMPKIPGICLVSTICAGFIRPDRN